MITRVKTKEGNFEFITQQYEVGLYVAVYNKSGIVDQFCSELSEEEFHKKLREDKDFKVIDEL